MSILMVCLHSETKNFTGCVACRAFSCCNFQNLPPAWAEDVTLFMPSRRRRQAVSSLKTWRRDVLVIQPTAEVLICPSSRVEDDAFLALVPRKSWEMVSPRSLSLCEQDQELWGYCWAHYPCSVDILTAVNGFAFATQCSQQSLSM